MAFMFEKLEVYQKAVDFADNVAALTEGFPRGYRFLADQLNRAALSIAANIAEGNGRFTKPDGLYNAQHRHAMYRWHVMDPVRFEKDLRVTIQVLGHAPDGGFCLGNHDVCSVAYWYQTLPTAPFPKLPERQDLIAF